MLAVLAVDRTAGFVLLLTVLAPTPLAEGRTPIVTYAALGAGVVAFVAGNVVTRIMATAQQHALVTRAESPAGERDGADVAMLLGGYQVRFIVACALLEGAGYFNGAAYLIEGQWSSLAMIAALAAGMLLLLPTPGRMRGWLERKLATLQQERQWTRP